jgi:hypothetical protein
MEKIKGGEITVLPPAPVTKYSLFREKIFSGSTRKNEDLVYR